MEPDAGAAETALRRRDDPGGEQSNGRAALDDRVSRAIERWRVARMRVAAAALDFQEAPATRPSASDPPLPVKRSLPRRKSLLAEHTEESAPLMRRRTTFPASRVRAARRLLVWTVVLMGFLAGTLFDRIFLPEKHREKSRRQRSAERLRRLLQRMGGTAIKIGQQAAMRLDMLPFEYGNELGKLLDKVDAFPTDQAILAIEGAAHRRLDEVFEAFDPKPIGSASVSCVYQAVLKTGQKVAVKVRRPNIQHVFVADCKALQWMLSFAEACALLKPGMSRNLVIEFRDMLMEELDFVREARNGELFMRRVKKLEIGYVTAPKIYFEHSSEAVLVTDFAEGIWVSELLSAVERKDERLLAALRVVGIEPKRVAKRLITVATALNHEGLMFHADPHPANIMVQADSKLLFIDFGSCGAYTERERVIWRRLLDAQAREDVGDMVQCAMAIVEPLPPIDTDEFAAKLEAVFWRDLYAFKSKHSEWWERTSANIWMSFLELAREYDIPMNLNTLRMIRSTLLYDTIAARIYNQIDAYQVYRSYLLKSGGRARKRVRKEVNELLERGPPKPFWLRVEQFGQLADKLLYFTRRFVDDPPYRFSLLASKLSYVLTLGLRTALAVLSVGGALVGYFVVTRILTKHPTQRITVGEALGLALRHPGFIVWAMLVLLITTRKIRMRLLDKEVD